MSPAAQLHLSTPGCPESPGCPELHWFRSCRLHLSYLSTPAAPATPTALRVGLINELVPHDELVPRAMQLAQDMAILGLWPSAEAANTPMARPSGIVALR